jgi:hypothetical protein
VWMGASYGGGVERLNEVSDHRSGPRPSCERSATSPLMRGGVDDKAAQIIRPSDGQMTQ